MGIQFKGKVQEYVEIIKTGESAFDVCAESIAAQIKDSNEVIIQSVFWFGETDVPFALRLLKDNDNISISFANADWQFYRTHKDNETYEIDNPFITINGTISAFTLFDSLTGSYVIKQETSMQNLKETLKELLKSEYFCDEPEDPFSEEPWDPEDEEHDLSYFVIDKK